jgi:hypothetical protein
MLWMALGEGWSFEMATPRGGGLRGFGVWRVEGGFLGSQSYLEVIGG